MALSSFSAETPAGRIDGVCDPKFEAVAEAFVANFTENDEVGANVCVMLEGETVVNLWGGRTARDGADWQEDTVSIVFSCTKAATALCAHMLADQGKLDLDAPVAHYWPEFADNGKEEATVSMMLDHSAGVPHVREKLKDGAYTDWDYMVDLIAREAPFWEPGTRNGYHGVTFAWTVGELVRRAAGMPMGEFFRKQVAEPLGLDFWIGLPEEIEPRVAPMIQAEIDPNAPPSKFQQAVMTDPQSPPHLFLLNNGAADFNSREIHAAEIGSANGITNGKGLAGMYAPLACGGTANGVTLVSEDTLARMCQTSMATHLDATLMIPSRFALGFMKSMDNRKVPNAANSSVIIGERAIGHVGMGGHFGFADPECGLSFGYNMNRMAMGILLNERGQALVDAAYTSLGYRSNASGCWEV